MVGRDKKPVVDEKRVAAAIKGALLADAACMGTHNILDPEKIKAAVSEDSPEFNDPPTPEGYSPEDYPGHYKLGMPSPWGEQLLFATEYCGKHKCVTPGHMSVKMKDWAENFGGYKDDSINDFLKCMLAADRSVELCGAEDERAHGFARIIPVVCLYAGEVDMLERVKDAVMVYQTNPKAIRFVMAASMILENILLGKTLQQALEQLMEASMSSSANFSVDDADVGDACLHSLMEAKMKDVSQLMQGLDEKESQGGKTAKLPSPFIINMFTFYKAIADGDIDEEAYIKAIRANILAGGDTCCRAIYMGAVLGAAAGSVPQSFVDKVPTEIMDKVEKAIEGILESIN